MTNLFLLSAAVWCGMMLFVSGAPLSTKCKIPSDLHIHYERLTAGKIRNKFLMPAEYIMETDNRTLIQGETTCPRTSPNSGDTKDRSSCPWYNKVVIDTTLFPPVRSEAVCRCLDCIGSNRMYDCEPVYSEMLFLQRTSVCVDGLFMYDPIKKNIPTECVCANKRINSSSNNFDI